MSDPARTEAAGRDGLGYLASVLGVALVAAILAVAMAFTRGWLAAIGVGVVVFLGAFGVGCFLGFLFGVPRVLTRELVQPSTAAKPGALSEPNATDSTQPPTPPAPVLQSNTNLERISDWLTTMLVGASLVQLYKINDLLMGFRIFLETYAKVFGAGETANAGVLPAIGPILLIMGAVAGFLFMYLNTRLILIRLFYQIERFLAGHDQVGPKGAEEIRSAVLSEGGGEFMKSLVAGRRKFSVGEALELMRASLYRPGGFDEAIRIAGALSDTGATRQVDYWFLLAAAFGQQYEHSKSAGDQGLAASARDNAIDAVTRAIAIDRGYRGRLKGLTNRGAYDNDLAALYEDDQQLQRLLNQA